MSAWARIPASSRLAATNLSGQRLASGLLSHGRVKSSSLTNFLFECETKLRFTVEARANRLLRAAQRIPQAIEPSQLLL